MKNAWMQLLAYFGLAKPDLDAEAFKHYENPANREPAVGAVVRLQDRTNKKKDSPS